MENIFTHIYNSNEWGNNKNNNYSGSSGSGSAIHFNIKYIKILKQLIKDYSINTIVDLGCGDFRIGRLIYDNLNISYTGYDTYKKIIDYHKSKSLPSKYTFKHLDFYKYKESIKEGDLCILKDVIQHWSTEEIYLFLDYLTESKKFKYILLVNCCNQKKDNETIKTGAWRPLSMDFLPLKKYNPIKIGNYKTKEISIIKI